MSTQHTHGPWVQENGGPQIIAPTSPNADSQWHAVALIYHFASDPNGEADANARLIAAAPDLLAALQTVYAKLHQWNGTSGPGAAAWIEQAQAAIAKATHA